MNNIEQEIAELKKYKERFKWLHEVDPYGGDFGTAVKPHVLSFSGHTWCAYTVGEIGEKPEYSTPEEAIDAYMASKVFITN